jgi:hypothetical protein
VPVTGQQRRVELGSQIARHVQRSRRSPRRSDIGRLVTERRNAASARFNALADEIERQLPALTDELVAWLLATIQTQVRARPHDPTNPWSVLIHRHDIELVFMELDVDALVGPRPHASPSRYVIQFDARCGGTQARAFVLGHELAHIELDNFERAAYLPSERRSAWSAERRAMVRAAERETDAYVPRRFSWNDGLPLRWPPTRRTPASVGEGTS